MKQKLEAGTIKALSNLSSLAAVMQAARIAADGDVLPCRPEGAFTGAEYCEFHGLKKSSALAQLQRLVREGKYETSTAYHPDSRGHMMPTNFYRVKAAGGKK